jgi:hypothetical protein
MRFSLDDGARSRGLWSARLRLLGMACLALMAMTAKVAALDSVSVTPGVSVAYETNQVPGTFIITRSGSTGSLDVNFSLAGTATLPSLSGADYTVTPALTGAATGTVSFIQGETSKTVTITPIDDALVEGKEFVTISLTSSANYIIGSSPSAQIVIADDDLVATIQVPDSTATEDPLSGFVTDVNIQRRGVVRVNFAPITNSFDRMMTVQFGGRATLNTDYIVRHKIEGNDNLYGTAANSQVGSDKSPGHHTTGLNYRVFASLSGDTTVLVNPSTTPLPAGSFVSFIDAYPGDTGPYQVATSTVNANSVGTITLTSPLLVSVPPGAAIKVGNSQSWSVAGYLAGATVVNLGDGFDGIFRGDVLNFAGDPAQYVALNDTDATTKQGPIQIRRYEGPGVGSGLNTPITALTEVVTLITTPLTGTIAHFLIPAESTRVDYSIEPISDGLVEGAEDVTVTMVGDQDYAIRNPTQGTVTIADVDSLANVVLGSNAGKPSTSGSFIVTLSGAFPIPITVPYTIAGSSTAVPGVDYVALSGSVTIPAGQTTGTIQVNPLNTPANGLTTLTISLNNTLDYKLVGSGSSGSNPSATLNITDSLGSVGIAATTPLAFENAVSPVPGAFTVTLNRNGPGAVSVNYVVTGSATPGTRYTPLSGSVTILAGQNTAQIPVVPIDNQIADGNQNVVVTLASGQGYSVDPLAQSGQVTIVDDEPVVSVVRVSDAIEPSTAGVFQVGYPGSPAGTPLNRTVVVNYTFSGTAVAGTDFASSSTVTIPANALSAPVLIGPQGNASASGKTVTLTISSSTAYTVGSGSDTLTILESPQATAAQTKPVPGSIDTGKSSGCGHGSGFATLIGLALLGLGLAVASLRRNR